MERFGRQSIDAASSDYHARVSTSQGSVRFVTFGCKANQYDTQVLREALLRRGWREQVGSADLVVLNTCTVTAEAGRKARSLARRLHRENPHVRIAMTGCLAESEPEILRELPGVEWVLGNGEAKRPVHFLRELGHELDPEELGIPAGITEFAGHTRAFLKIQDGCDMACAFCIIPSVRGPSRSRPAAELAHEVERLLLSGHREIVLCGIHIGHWGREIASDLGQLLQRLVRVTPVDSESGLPIDWRLRLSSIEATEVVGPVLDAFVEHPRRIAPHLHMPMQTGDDRVLRAMNRWYDVATYLDCCDQIRARLERPAFTADVLVGFPGEDDAAFENTLETVRRAGFSRLHVFPFSPMPGTAAAIPSAIGTPVPPPVMRERRARLSELAHGLTQAFRRSLVGALDTIALEGTIGLSGRYQRIRIPVEDLPRQATGLVDVRLALDPQSTRDEAPDQDVRLIGRPVQGAPGHRRKAAELSP